MLGGDVIVDADHADRLPGGIVFQGGGRMDMADLPAGQHDAEAMIDGYKAIKPVAIECCFTTVTPEVLRLLQKVKSNGSKIWINSLWASLNGGHDDDRAVEMLQPDESWGWILQQGASLMQTDRPHDLLIYLQKHNRR